MNKYLIPAQTGNRIMYMWPNILIFVSCLLTFEGEGHINLYDYLHK